MTDYRSAEPRRGSRTGVLLLSLIAFLAGLAAMAWALSRWDAAARFIGIEPEQPVAAAQPVQPPAQAAQPVQAQPPPEGEVAQRLSQLEQRIAALDNEAREAAGNADRAEGLLVAFAARRALDRGVALGYIEGLLRQRFASTQPQAVATVITASRQPVTLEELQEGLQEVGPNLTGAGPDQNWWDAFRAEFNDLITVRKAGTPSTMPDERLRRATRRLESGQVDVALAEVLRMPGRDKAAAWVEDARRYVSARRALDTIETAALLEPRREGPVAAPAAPETASPARPAI